MPARAPFSISLCYNAPLMLKIIGKQNLSPSVRRLDIRVDALVARLHPGQFIAVMPDRFSRCVPMNVYEVDFRRRCFSLVFEEQDAETMKMGALRINDTLFAVNGPYGVALPSAKRGTLLFVGEELGVGSVVSLCRSYKQTDNKVIGIAGFDKRLASTLENQMRLNCTKFYVMYKDGTHERRGDVLGPLRKVLADQKPQVVYAHAAPGTMQGIAACCRAAAVPLWFNVMDLLEGRPSFHASDTVWTGTLPLIPARDGIWVDSQSMDINAFMQGVAAAREYKECRSKEAEQLRSKSVWARFRKFIWG